ncbi:mitochondrial large ribosomal subunit L49 [Metarhizium album ARSEF 1941]|uniref:Large ribosomal subunit protein mL49 n=1 Tax=Metarhizium album (strain ARSEF 1941) TaxID=1081103 RepID=A0A0B2WW99_METAS|nr:mitochondrial large ribosomal subunit L49 [Metarhizium album ARSEF 1941]KHN97165.1 mitochondrial large ribosomal subunit L49 [Metarhizium album ARSEF 1941]
MHQGVSRAICRWQNHRLLRLRPSICGAAINSPSSLAVYGSPSWSPPSRPLTNAAGELARSYTPISRASTPPPTKSPEELAGAPYIVRRTPSTQLPVYRRSKSGGNRQVVFIKKVDGDRKKLLEDLVESLGVSKEDVRLNPTTQHIELKGNYYDKTKSWLLERGF